VAVIFAADDGIHGQELWITNGTAEGTRAIQPPALSNPVLLSAFTAVDDKFMFIGQSEHGLGLWQTDGTDEGTTELATVGPADATAFSLVEAGGKWFVTVVTGGVNELWITDGTSAGTRYLTDLGVRSAFHSANSIAATSNGKFVFSNADANGDKELWVTDGTTAGTQLLKDIGQGLVEDTNWPLSSEPKGFVSVNGNVVFGTVLSASGLYVSDGTVAGTQPITGFAHVALAGAQTTANSVIFLSFPRWSNTYEIWVTDGTQAGTQILKSLSTTGSSGGALVGVADGAFVTLADLDASNGIFSAAGLYFTDGTSAGTRMLLSAPVAAASDFTKLDQNYVFIGDGLWHTDLTEAGTQQISTVAVSRTWSIEPFAELDGKLSLRAMTVSTASNYGSLTAQVQARNC
jgi:ELWxxDGT repeat protein